MPTLLAKFNDRDIEIILPDKAPVVGVTGTEAVILVDGTEYCCEWVKHKAGGTVHYSLLIDNRPVMVSVRSKDERFRMSLNSRELTCTMVDKRIWDLKKRIKRSDRVVTRETIRSPMSGQIVRIQASVGDILQPQSPVVTLEAMKMEMDINTVKGGKLEELKVKIGDGVEADMVLAVINTVPENKDKT